MLNLHSLLLQLRHIRRTRPLMSHLHLKRHPIILSNSLTQLVDMDKYTLSIFRILNESESFFIIEESNDAGSDIRTAVFLLAHPCVHVFLLEDFHFSWIRL